MNLANKAFKNVLKKLFPKFTEQAKQAVGEAATSVHFRERQTIQDPEKIRSISERTIEAARMSGAGEWSPKEVRTIERSMQKASEKYIDKAHEAYEMKSEEIYKKIDALFEQVTDPTQRRAELEEMVRQLTAYCETLPVKTELVVDMFMNNNFKGAKEYLENAFTEEGYAIMESTMNDNLVKTFVNPAVVDDTIRASKEARLKAIFYPQNISGAEGKTASKFDIVKDDYIAKMTKKMPDDQKAKFVEEFNKKYKMPDDIEKADSDFFSEHIKFYNDLVSDSEKVKYGLRERLEDKYQMWSKAQKEMGEFGTPLAAKELTENTVLKMLETGSGLVTNMAKAFSWFKGVEDFTAESFGRAMNYFEKLPRFKVRNNELGVAAGVALKRYKADKIDAEKQLALQYGIRGYIENLTKEGQLTQIGYNGHNLTANVELMRKFGLGADDVEFANKIINSLRLTKKHMDMVADGLYDEAANIMRRFEDVDGLDLIDVSDMRRNHPSFGFVDNYFPIVPNQQYKEALAKMQSGNDRTDMAYIARQIGDLMDEKRIEPTFFLHMRRLGESAQGSRLKNDPTLRMSPADELLTYAKSVDNYYKGRGYRYFDQIENSHVLYNVVNKYGRDEALARNKLIEGLRKQYDEAMNPLGLGDTKLETLLSTGLTLEASTALVSPRMWFLNSLQGLQMGGAIAGRRNHIKAWLKSLSAERKALLHTLTGGEGFGGRSKFLQECYSGKFDKPLYGDDAIIANNIGAYLRDEPLTGLNMADVKYLVSKSVDEKLRMKDTKIGKIANDLMTFANFGFKISEEIARTSTIDASTKHFLDSARKTIAHIQAHPEMTNPEAVRFLAKELHLDALNNAWKVDKILNNVAGENLVDALSDNKVLQRMSQDYAFACVKHQIFEYDAINQSALKSKLKHTTRFGGIAMTFKQWGFHWSEYFAGIVAAAYHGDTVPLKKLAANTIGLVAAASFAASLGDDKKYKKGKPQEFEDWLKQGISNTAKYARQRDVLFTPISIMQMPMDEIAGLTKPVFGGGLWLGAAVVNLAGSVPAKVFGIENDSPIFQWAESAGAEAALGSVTFRKIKDLKNNIVELGGSVK